MAVQDGYSRYSCDVASCGASAYARPDSDGADAFSLRTRIDSEGVERTVLVCADHAKVYAAIAKAMDQVWDAFCKDGTDAMVTQADVAAVQEQLDQANAATEAAKAETGTWVKKYKVLKAEYDAYKEAHPDASGTTTEGGEA